MIVYVFFICFVKESSCIFLYLLNTDITHVIIKLKAVLANNFYQYSFLLLLLSSVYKPSRPPVTTSPYTINLSDSLVCQKTHDWQPTSYCSSCFSLMCTLIPSIYLITFESHTYSFTPSHLSSTDSFSEILCDFSPASTTSSDKKLDMKVKSPHCDS